MCFHIMERMGQNQRRRECFVQFARWRQQSDVSDCIVLSNYFYYFDSGWHIGSVTTKNL